MSNAIRCPGPSRKDFHPEDIFSSACPECGAEIEFWRDDKARPCPQCKKSIPNPHKTAKT